ncbi:hypothetical protein [Psychrobacillus sp. NPDC093180]|uniref:hypothetical protein n=1 Tax=Psychrobacillus sp. NPDC093180 TaxID=3364489 RepID=UPI003802F963
MKRLILGVIAIAITLIGIYTFYIIKDQEYVYAKKSANILLEFELPKKTKALKEGFDYGVLYGGGPWGSGGRPTVVAYKRISTELSEKEIYKHYNTNDFEIYFDGLEDIIENSKGQIWYEGTIKDEHVLSSESNENKPIEVIVQYRTEFSYPLFIDLH